MNQFIVLEGVDASGKTTIGRRLASENDALYMRTPGEAYKPIREFIDKRAPPRAKLLFYLSSVVEASHHIATSLGEHSVVCDRYVWSTFVPHVAYHGGDIFSLEGQWKSVTKGIVRPHTTILLQVSEEEQIRRIREERTSQPTSASDAFCLDPIKRRRVRELYDETADRLGWMRIDTTDRTIESVIEEINRDCFGYARRVTA